MKDPSRISPARAKKPSFKPYKFFVQAVVQRVENGQIVGEVTGEPVEVYGCDALAEWATTFPTRLAQEIAATLAEAQATE